MKTTILFFSILILCTGLAAAETEIFSGIVVTDTDKDIDGDIFRFSYDETSNKVLVQTPATSLIIDNGACKSSSVFRVCINRANFSYKNISDYKYYYEIDATIYKLTGSLSANSSVSLITLLQGESAEFAITITNPTDFFIGNITYNQDFAPFTLAKASGCALNENNMTWQGSLESSYYKKCTATIIAVKEGAYSLAGNLKYFNSLDTEEKTTEPASVKVLPKQLQLIKFIDNNTQVKQPFYMNMSLQNVHDEEDITLSIKIEIPANVDVLKTKPDFDITARTLKRGIITLRPGAFFNYSLYLEETSEGYDPITQEFHYIIKGISDLIENSTLLRQPKIEPIAEPKIENAVPENQSTAVNNQSNENATAATEISTQLPQDTKTENTSANPQQENKTAGQVIITETPKQSFVDKKTLILVALAFLVLLIVFLVVNRIRKRKKVSPDVTDQLIKELEEKLGKS
ncbi:hypothetical protein HYW20_08115 [Candidatus Woesearchaeota archaeon]|nr:hypothetical protein [Candidatus Woesearchaeota archaeon]